MISFEKNTMNAKMTRGDSASLKVRPLDKNTGEYFLKDGDTLRFTLKKSIGGDAIINKTTTEFEDGYGSIDISANETLDLQAGTYIYTLVAERLDGNVDTLVPNGQAYFNLKERL